MLRREDAAPASEGSERLRRRSRTSAVVIAVVAVLVVLAGVAVAVVRPEPTDPAVGAVTGATPTAPAPSRPSAEPSPAAPSPAGPAMPTPVKLAAALRGPLGDPGLNGRAGLQVRDLTTGTVLFDQDAAVPGVPASTAKVLTAAVVLDEFGPQTRLETRAFAVGSTVYLVGGGDPTLAPADERRVTLAHGTLDGPARLADLAHQVRAAGVTRVDRVVGDASLFSGPPLAVGWRPYYLQSQVAPVSALTVAERRTADPAASATAAMRDALTAAGVPVGAVGSGRVPPQAKLVGTVSSPPLATLVRHMLAESDNDLAENLGRLLAIRTGHPADFAGTAAALLAGLERLELPSAGLRLNDASGLSLEDRLTPAVIVDVLRRAADPAHPELKAVLDGLPVAGRTGTLATRFSAADTRAGVGAVRAKSGRLLGVNALAGLVTTQNGRVLVFALRGPTAGLAIGEHAVDRIAATLATCGCR